MNNDVNQLADEFEDFRREVQPSWAHMIGDYRWADQFEDISRDAEDYAIALGREFQRQAETLDEAALDPQQRITRAMVAWHAQADADMLESRMAEFAVDPIFGEQANLIVIMPKLTMPDAEAAEAMHDKVRAIATYFRDLADRHREGLASGRTAADFAIRQTVAQMDGWLAKPVADDPLMNTAPLPSGVDESSWREQLAEIIETEVRPALAHYRQVLRDELAPKARPDERCGLTWLADGEEAYARAVRFYTTVDLTPQEIHEIGLRQVESLAEEYRVLGREVLGIDDVPAILKALRSDKALHHDDAAQIVADSKAAMAKARAAMPDWFGLLPQSECDVEATTNGAIAYYFPPPQDNSRGGVFFMNVSEPQAWGRFQIEATSYHEGIPGHHLQLAIATELEGLPEFRKRAMIAAYAEGWGLYTERLADEMGIYSSSMDRMGMLSADSMRACRLVVDTGMHALGWSREKAVDYMVANSPMGRPHVIAEVDRYAVAPGQALAYMIGRLEIQRMRREAEQRMADRFDIKKFHDVVLGSGPMPLRLLDEFVAANLT